MPLSRWLQILGITHFILAALASIGAVLAIAGIFWVAPIAGSTPESAEAKFGNEVAYLTLGTVAAGFSLLLPITILLGNRLFYQRWRVFCIVMAGCELLWGLFPGAIVAFIFFTELTLQYSSTTATILIAALSAAIPAIPIALAIATIIALSIPSKTPRTPESP